MRATEYLFLVIMIGLVSIVIMMGATDLNQVYTNTTIDTSNLSQFNDFSKITDQANKTFDNFQKLGDDTKWYQKIGAGIIAIPYAVISFPIMIAQALTILTKFMGVGLIGIVPTSIILIMISLLLVEVVKRMMEFFQRSRS
jgi:hypothetical protein